MAKKIIFPRGNPPEKKGREEVETVTGGLEFINGKTVEVHNERTEKESEPEA
jgi:hypothetical protein